MKLPSQILPNFAPQISDTSIKAGYWHSRAQIRPDTNLLMKVKEKAIDHQARWVARAKKATSYES